MTLGQIIKKCRIEQGLTQADLGRMLNKAESTVRTWELGRAQPNNRTLIKLGEIFKVPMNMLLGVQPFENLEFIMENKKFVYDSMPDYIKKLNKDFAVPYNDINTDIPIEDSVFYSLVDMCFSSIDVTDEKVQFNTKIAYDLLSTEIGAESPESAYLHLQFSIICTLFKEVMKRDITSDDIREMMLDYFAKRYNEGLPTNEDNDT